MSRWHRRCGRIAALACLGFCAAAPVRAQLKAEPSTIDLGARQENQTVTAEVRLVNAGANALEILEVRSDCSCTVGVLEKRKLAAGESTALKVEVETRGYHGVLHRSVRVVTTDNELTLPIALTVSPFKSWMLEPATLVLPPSQKGTEASLSASLSYTGADKATLGAVTCEPAWLKAEATSTTDSAYRLVFTKTAAAPAGNHSVRVKVATSIPTEPALSFNVYVPVLSALKASPNPVVLPTVKVGQSSTRDFLLQGWTAAKAPRLEIDFGSARLLDHDGERWHFEVTMTAAVQGPSSRLLRVYDGDSLEAEIPVILRAEPKDKAK